MAGRGQVDEAIAHYRKALEIKPDYVEAHNNLGNALAGRGEVDEAIAHYRKALEIKPDYAEAHNNLGTALAGRGEVDEAIAHFRKALEIKPDYAEAHYNLGRALAGRGRLDEAIAHFQKALALASAQNDRDLADAIRAEISATNRLRPAATHRKGRQRSKKCKRSAEGCQDAYNTAGFRSTQALPRRVVSAKAVALCPFRRLPRPIFPISTEEV